MKMPYADLLERTDEQHCSVYAPPGDELLRP
ncbi:MAG: hypothetical protein JWM16_3162 [Verrucomicrobiales bacterium]|nr:hypothetical protein [Verrucomicrobiales bacterium]